MRTIAGAVMLALATGAARAERIQAHEEVIGGPPDMAGRIDALEFASYRAHVAAAEASLRLDDGAAARRWLDAAPAAHRNWEWRHLRAATDLSLKTARAHDEAVFRLAFSPDGRHLATASPDATARIWPVEGGAPVDLRGHEKALFEAAFSPDGTRVVTASRDGTARLWDAATGEQLSTLCTHDRPISSVAFSPDGRHLATSTYVLGSSGVVGRIVVSDPETGTEVLALDAGDKPISMVRYSPDGARIAAGTWGFRVFIWDAATGQLQHELEVPGDEMYAAVDAIAFSPDGTRIAACGKDWLARVWEVTTGKERLVLRGHRDWVSSVAFSADGRMLATASRDGTARLWDAERGDTIAVLHGHGSGVTGVAFRPGGHTLTTGAQDGSLREWSARIEDYGASTLLQRSGDVYDAVFSPDGRLLATVGHEGSVNLWEATTGRRLAALVGHNDPVVSAAFSSDGARLVTGSYDLTVRVWDTATGAELWLLFPRTTTVSSVAFSADDRVIASVGGGQLRLFDAATGERLEPPRTEARWLGVDAAGALLAWAETADGLTARRAITGEHVVTLAGDGMEPVFHPEGTLIATGSADGDVRLWDAATGEPAAVLRGHRARVRSLAFSPDGTRLATASQDNTVALWGVASARPVVTLHGYSSWVYELAFSPDGTRLATCPLDGTVVILETQPLAERLRARDLARAAEAAARPMLAALMTAGLDPAEIAARLRADPALTDETRGTALTLLLREVAGP